MLDYRRLFLLLRTGIVLFLLESPLASGVPQDRVHLYSLMEESPPETFIANLLIDSGLAIKYSSEIVSKLSFVFLKEVEHLELFSLDRRNGILRTSRSVDRDIICPGQLNCVLRLDIAVQPSVYFEVVKIEMTILDTNDNSPTFESTRFSLIISEGTSPGERFVLPTASDVDSVPNGVVEYRLISTTTFFQLDVRHDLTGRPKEVWLILLKELDREDEGRFELLMASYDGGIPRRSAVLGIDIQVGDVNDNSPKFRQSTYNVSVSENAPIGATITSLFASDADTGQNGHVRYRFSQRSESNYGDLFAIDPESGDVVLLQMLEHASANVYSLGVIAEDQGEFSSPALAALIVTVIDVNDHAPQIVIDVLSAGGSVEVVENSEVGSFVAHVSTVDKDGGDNGLVRCSINNNNFKLLPIYDGEYKLVTAAVFDREKVRRYEAMIRCHDMGEPRQHVSKVIIVNVADVNDNHPVFIHTIYNASVEENLPWGTFIVRVSAHDPDEGANGEIVYLLDSDADQRFHIDPDAGVITTLDALDREVSDVIEFHVLASNKGEHGLVSRALIRIRVTDVDDEGPRFTRNRFVFDVYENQPAKTEVGQLTAVDLDLAPFNSFSFVLSGNKVFGVDSKSGTIFTKRTLDRETQNQYELTAEVLSNTVVIKRDVAKVTINVIDTNDNAPNITFPNELEHIVIVPSTVKVFETVCTVTGFDLDNGVNSELFYEILDGNGTNHFGLDPVTGKVKLLKKLLESVNDSFALVIRARDGGTPVQYSTTTLHLTVVDGNQILQHGTPIAENQWTWFSDLKIVAIAGFTASFLIFVAIFVAAILFVRKRSRRRQAKQRLAMMKTEMTNLGGSKDDDDDDDDGDSLNRMKMMMNDGKMVRMKDISYTELNADIPSKAGNQLSGGSGTSSSRGGAGLPVRLHHVTAVGPSAGFDPETDSGCADVSHCNDDLSSGSERSTKDVDTGPKDRLSIPHDRHLASSSLTSQNPRLHSNKNSSNHVMPNHVTVSAGGPVKGDARFNSLTSPSFRSSPPSSSSSSSTSSLPMNSSSLLSGNRKSVRFADNGGDVTRFAILEHIRKDGETDRGRPEKSPNVGELSPSFSGRRKERDATGKILTYAHQYPTHVGMTTFLSDDGSLV